MASLPKSHTDRRQQFSRAPFADALEDAGAVFYHLGDRFKAIDPQVAAACDRANRSFWRAGKAVRALEMNNG